MWRFSVARSLASFLNEVATHKYQLADMVGFLIGELTKKSCFLFGVVFAILRCKSKAGKHDDGEDYLQAIPANNAARTKDHSVQQNVFRYAANRP